MQCEILDWVLEQKKKKKRESTRYISRKTSEV